jgi:hypothetical protein
MSSAFHSVKSRTHWLFFKLTAMERNYVGTALYQFI